MIYLIMLETVTEKISKIYYTERKRKEKDFHIHWAQS